MPRGPAKKTLSQLNPDNLPPVRKSIGIMDLTVLDEFGTDKLNKKWVRDEYPTVLKPAQLHRK